jgi:opacity protein-like surface antigen
LLSITELPQESRVGSWQAELISLTVLVSLSSLGNVSLPVIEKKQHGKRSVMAKTGAVIAAMVFLFTTGAAQAGDVSSTAAGNRLYVGGNIGFSYSADPLDNTYDAIGGVDTLEARKAAFSFGLVTGVDLGKNLGVQLGYARLGQFDVKDDTSGGKLTFIWNAATLAVLLKAPLQTSASNPMSAFLKLGVAKTHLKLDASGPGGSVSESDDKTTFVPGVGLKIDSSDRVSAIFEIDYYDKLAGSEDGYKFSATTFTGGLLFRF